MRSFEGTVRVRLNAEKGCVTLARGVKGSTLTAADAEKIAEIAIEAATAHKVGLDRWAFYIPEVSEKLPKDPKATLDPKAAAKAIKAGGKPTIGRDNWGNPKLRILPDTPSSKAKVSKYVDIA